MTDLNQLTHPQDQNNTTCTRGTPHPKTNECHTHQCDLCTTPPFCTQARLARHRTTHTLNTCRYCHRTISIKGHTQHEDACAKNPQNHIKQLLPTTAWEQRLEDFLHHATQVPPNTICLITQTSDPAFWTPQEAAKRLPNTNEITLAIPTHLFPQLTEQTAARYRRRPHQPPTPNPTPEPTTNQPNRLFGNTHWANTI